MATSMNTRLRRLIASARAALVWERLWPAVAPMIGVVALFVATALMGLWSGKAPLLKGLALVAFGVLFVAASWRLRRLRMPAREDALRRLEDDAALPHRPLGAYEDSLAAPGDPVTESLWRVHRRRAQERLASLRYAVPRAGLVPHDPYGLRAVVGIVLFVGILVGAGAVAERLLTPFDFSAPVASSQTPQFRLDAWVTPPSYTGRSPLFLSAATRVETADGIRVPAGSVLTVRAQGEADVGLFVTGAAEDDAMTEQEMAALSETGTEATARQGVVSIDGSMAVEVRRDGVVVETWRFVADGDLPPTAEITEAPKADTRNGFELRYHLDDDYAIAGAEALVTPHAVGAPGRRPLVENPTFALTLPGGSGGRGAGRTVEDLSAHPFAGLEASVRVRATDGVGQTGISDAREFRVPARTFVNPVARVVVEQRTRLALDANAHVSVIDALDLILLTPDRLGGAGAFLAVRAAYRELVAAHSDDELRGMLESLWQLALMLEDDGMSDAERALQAAQERLRQALEDGASEEEIARLTQELREAMQQYLQALADRAQSMQQQAMDPNAQTLSQQNLDDLLKRIEELAKQGRHDEAEALLAELQQMMQNLQMAQRGQGQQGDPMGQAGRTLDELGRMIQRQQELMDETYGMNQDGQQGQQGQGQQGQMDRYGQDGQQGQRGQQGRNGRPQPGGQGDPSMSPQERAEALQRLQEQQQALRQQLEGLMRQLEEQGFDPGERLDDAGRSMGDAGESLGEGETGTAVGEQGDALQALREGAQSMAQQLAEAQPGNGAGQGEDYGAPDQGPGRDPLGRTRREGTYADTSRVGVPDEIEAQRARRILQELRRRLGDMGLPRLERDYLERLLPQ